MGVATARGEGGVGGHLREIFRAVFVAQQLQGEGNAGVLAVAVIGAGGSVIAVGDGTLVNVRAEEFPGTDDGGIDLRILDAEFLREGDEEKAAVARGVERAVSGVHLVQFPAVEVRVGEGVPPAAAAALAHGGVDGVFAQGGEDEVIAGGIVIDRAIQPAEAMVPALHALVALVAGLEHRPGRCGGRKPWGVRTAHPVMHDLAVLRLAGGDQCNRLDDAALAAARVLRVGDEFFLKHLPCVLQDLLCLRAIVGRGVAVGGHGAQLQLHLEGLGDDGKLVEAHLGDFLAALLLGLPVVERIVIADLFEELVDIDPGDVLLAEAGGVVLVAPHLEGDLAAVLLFLGLDDRIPDQNSEVPPGLELLPVDSRDHIAQHEFALRRRPVESGLHLDLIAHKFTDHQPHDPGRPEIPWLRLLLLGRRDEFALGEIGQGRGAFHLLGAKVAVFGERVHFLLGVGAFLGGRRQGEGEGEECGGKCQGFHHGGSVAISSGCK